MNNKNSIKTEYNGTIYRSRLEATWAAFFDIVKWEYQYEPYDLCGWIPDFVIHGKTQDTLVEVKPFGSFKEFEDSGTMSKINDSNKINKEVLLLGYSIFKSICWGDGTTLGWLKNEWYAEAVLDDNGFYHSENSYKNRVTGEWDGDHHLSPTMYKTAKQIFNKAQNLTRWNQ